jgi:pectate lyase
MRNYMCRASYILARFLTWLPALFLFFSNEVPGYAFDAVFSDDFTRADSVTLGNGWTEVAGDLAIQGNQVQDSGQRGDHIAVQLGLAGAAQQAAVDFTPVKRMGIPRFGVLLRYRDPRNYYVLYRNVAGDKRLRIAKVQNGAETLLASVQIKAPRRGETFRLEGLADGSTLTLKINGQELLSATDATFASGAPGLLLGLKQLHPPVRFADNFSAAVSRTPPPVSLPAFPGAEGFGATTSGGRYGTIVRVTNLDDSGPGSLRDALAVPVPRIVVFDVSGTITLNSAVRVPATAPYVTIAGQTAPGDGIALRKFGLEIRTHNVVARHLRLRTGAEADNRLRAVLLRDASNVVVDHCSISWGPDENLALGGTSHDVTLQRCLLAEGLYETGKPLGPHSSGFIQNPGVTNISVHHNLFAHNDFRNPYVEANLIDIRNNLIYNYGRIAGHLGKEDNPTTAFPDVLTNWIGNYVKAGLNSDPATRSVLLQPNRVVHLYVEDNIDPLCDPTMDGDWCVVNGVEAASRVLTPFDAPPVTTQSATQVFDDVLDDVGALVPIRDSVDERVTNDVRNGTGTIIDDPSQVGGWPELLSETPLLDSDNDGMPDDWELANGFNPTYPDDGKLDADGDGYTNVEEYLNALTGDVN